MAPDIGFRDRLPSMDASIVAVFETQACADDPLLSAGSILSSATRRTQIARLTGRRPATLVVRPVSSSGGHGCQAARAVGLVLSWASIRRRTSLRSARV